MQKIRYTKEQVREAYDELKRRLDCEVWDYPAYSNGAEMPEKEYFELARSMVDGLYAVFMATASNWPEIVQWSTSEETERGLVRMPKLVPMPGAERLSNLKAEYAQ